MWNLYVQRTSRAARSLLYAAAAALLVPLAGCDDILEVDDPDVVRPDQLQGADAIPTRVAGAVLDFQIAFNGNFNNGLVPAQGLFTDEYIHSETFTDRLEIDRRSIDRSDNQMTEFLFSSLHVARVSAQQTGALIEEHEPDHEDRALVHSLEGFAELLLAETFCSGVAASSLDGNTIVFGQPRTTDEVFEAAVSRFDQALAADAGFQLARVGKARALLGLGRFAEAASVAAAVPDGFEHYVHHSSTTPSQQNGLWNMSFNGRMSVSEQEGGNGAPFRSALDPRVRWVDSGSFGFDDSTPLFLQLVQPEIDSDVLLASDREARLIEAEAALRAGSRNTFFAIHNDLRGGSGLAPLQDTGQTEEQLTNIHFRERAFWLYSTGHRLGDLRRLVRHYGRDPESVFPSGTHHKGAPYGSDVNFPIPVQEDNNPNTAPLSGGCLDRSA